MRVKSLVLLVAILTLGISLGAPNADAAKKAVKKPADVKAAQEAAPAASSSTKEPAQVPAATSTTQPAQKAVPAIAATDNAAPKYFTFVVNKTGATLWVQVKDAYLRTPVAPNGVYTVARGAEMTLSANDGKTAMKKATASEMKVVVTDLSTPIPEINGLKQAWDKFAKFTAAHNSADSKTASE